MPQVDWSIMGLWNQSLLTYSERPLKPRDNIYASELGGAYIDRYLKMLGTKPTNPPNNRSLRKFQAGNIWEAIIGYVLLRAGVLQKRQIRAEVQIPKCCLVSGRLDFVAGGVPDWEKAEHEINQLDPFFALFPEFVRYATQDIIENLKAIIGENEMLVKILEAKSVGSFVFERAKKVKVANANHLMQNFHYIFGSNGIDFGDVMYICRDDCRILEFPVYSTSLEIQRNYENDIRTMSEYYIHKELPPKEAEIFFDDAACKFSKNWKVEYSYYLTKLYKYKTPEEYRQKYAAMTAKYNRVLKRCVNGDRMTDDNKLVIREAKKSFPKWDDYVIIARERGVLEVVEEEAED